MEEDDWNDINRIVKELMNKFFSEFIKDFEEFLASIENGSGSERFFGLRIEVGPDGNPRIYRIGGEEFEKESPRVVVVDEGGESGKQLIDIYDDGSAIEVVAEVPVVSEENVGVVALDDSHILIDVVDPGSGARYRREVELPAKIDPKTIKTLYRNGVLKVKAVKKSVVESGNVKE